MGILVANPLGLLYVFVLEKEGKKENRKEGREEGREGGRKGGRKEGMNTKRGVSLTSHGFTQETWERTG